MRLKRLIPYLAFWVLLAGTIVVLRPSADAIQSEAPRPLPISSKKPCSGGGPPEYCAYSGLAVVLIRPMAAPRADAPFRDPDFGSRMVRVTDATTLSAYSNGYYTGISFVTDSSAEANTWGKFDPSLGAHGGYRFVVTGSGGAIVPFILDPDTMHVTRLKEHGDADLSTRGFLDLSGVSFSYTNPALLFGAIGTKLVSDRLGKGRKNQIYDFARCPGLPPYVSKPWMYSGSVGNSNDDTKFAYYFGGTAQGETDLAAFYDRSAENGAGACYWYDTRTGLVGGTNMSPVAVANERGQLPPPPAPSVTARPGGGNLPAGNYYVKITELTRMDPTNGETAGSREAGPIHLSSPGSLEVDLPRRVSNPSEMVLPGHGCSPYHHNLSGCTPFNVYIGSSPGAETLQNTQGPVGGAAYVQSTLLKSNTPHPPRASTAGYNIHNARISRNGAVVRIDDSQGQTIYFWRAGTNQVTACLFDTNDCGGHLAMGYTNMINHGGGTMGDVLIRPFSTPQTYRQLFPLNPSRQYNDSHWSWNDDKPGDTEPVCGSYYNEFGHGDGTQNPLTNPLLAVTGIYDGEIVCIATSGPPTIWRFAHHRSVAAENDSPSSPGSFWGTPRGNVSQDGKFYMFTSNWAWSLGNEKGSAGCPSSGTCRTDVFIGELR